MVTLYSGKVELGTGALTAITQIAAEELSVPFARVTTIQGDTALTPNQGPTYASLSIQDGGMQIRRAAATARDALLDEAARKLGVAKAELVVRDGVVGVRDGSRSVSYVELVGNRQLTLKVNPTAPLKDPKDYTIVGKSVPRVDIPAKIFGTFDFVQDVKVPGMLHARVVHPAGVGSTLLSFDDAACRKIKGYVRAVRKGDFLAVVATNEWAAISASTTIVAEVVGLGRPAGGVAALRVRAQLQDRAHGRVPERGQYGRVVQGGRPNAAGNVRPRDEHAWVDRSVLRGRRLQEGPADGVDAVAGQPPAAPATCHHAADETGERPVHLRRRCRMLWTQRLRRLLVGSGADLPKEIGSPVRLQWMRWDEHGWDPKGPPVLLDYRARIDDQGGIAAWESDIFGPERPMQRSGVTLLAAKLANLPKYGPPGAPLHNIGLGIPYALPNNKFTAHWLVDTPLPAAWIRAPGRMQDTFGNESFLDEIAAATNVDPFEIRKRYLTDARGLELLERLRQFAKWEPRGTKPRDVGPIARGRGVSYTKYELVRTYVGIVADVTVDRKTGHVKVERVFVVHDCGQIINPDGLRNQIEGNVVQALSRTLVEKLTFSRSAVTSLNWGSYPILTFPNVPEVVVDLIDRPTEVPWGAGEPTTSVVPSAIANAVYDATGARLRSVPFRPEVVLAALSATPRN